MKYFSQYVRTVESIIDRFNGSSPLHSFLKRLFAEEKKFGSTDRKRITELLFAYYRTKNILPNEPLSTRLIAGLYLTQSQETSPWQSLYPTGWAARWSIEPLIRWEVVRSTYTNLSIDHLFLYPTRLSPAIDQQAFCLSYLQQPKLYIRIRPSHWHSVVSALHTNHVPFQSTSPHGLVLENGVSLKPISFENQHYVVQDLSSQGVFDFFDLLKSKIASNPITVWDCCAGGGGKSIAAQDGLGNIQLWASDHRARILVNLKERLQQAHIKAHSIFQQDLTDLKKRSLPPFDIILCDAPCSGSGTWSRTPESLHTFNIHKLSLYATNQLTMLNNLIPYLKPTGFLVYITCSVFEEENEAVVEKIVQQHILKTICTQYWKGYTHRADTLFGAIFTPVHNV